MDALPNNDSPPKLILGTVQLGMPYGIANTSGQPDRATARAIVKAALDNGIRHFDTAQAYGNSETVLGESLNELGVSDKVCVTSKLSGALDPTDTAGLHSAIEGSFSRLRINRLGCLLLHKPGWLSLWDEGLGDTLRQYQEEGRVGALGVSLGTVADAPAALAHPDVAILQAPCNAWDRRMVEQGYLQKARVSGRLCCIRSLYLQGLLTMSPEAVAAKLPLAREAASRWWELSRTFGISPKALALRYALALGAPLVVGAESPEQVTETARLTATLKPLSPEEVQTLASAMDPVLNETILEPWRWEQHSS